jgi:hypothetical protein
LAPVLVLIAAAACGGSSTLSESGLRKQAEALQSTAAEGAILAGDVALDRSTEPFARVHSGELADQAGSSATSLHGATAPKMLDADRKRAAATAVRIERALERLHDSPTNRAVARAVERELERDARTAAQLAG